MPTKKLKASERQAIARKLVTLLKKKYGGTLPKHDFPVLEMMLYATCLEDTTDEAALAGYERLLANFEDLNEIRVSSISEIERALGKMPEAEWRALRIRDTVHYIFEKYYAFNFEDLKKKTVDAAEKQLSKIETLTPFICNYTLQQGLGVHVVPLDESIHRLTNWLGLTDADSTIEQASDDMKSAVRKADAPLLCHLLRCVAVDPAYAPEFDVDPRELDEQDIDGHEAASRLDELIKSGGKKRKTTRKKTVKRPSKKKAAKATKKKTSRKKTTAKKKTVKKKVAKPNRKKATKRKKK